MNKIFHSLLSTLAAITIIAGCLSFASVNAIADDEGCSLATREGHGIETSGSIVAVGPTGSVSEAGVIKFNGEERFHKTQLSA